MIDSTCNSLNLTQLVAQPTRHQFNSVRQTTSHSIIDHIYTNSKYRCSDVKVISFGASDHDIIGYTRFSIEPSQPSRTIRKRSYKNFDASKFLNELKEVDWTPVLVCDNIHFAVEILTIKFTEVLDKHCPWVIYQQRKNFNPWLSQSTLDLMKERDKLKAQAIQASSQGKDSAEKWGAYKVLRNRINNRRKYEEKSFKSEKLKESINSSSNTWKVAKTFMDWTNKSGSPCQLDVSGKLVTRAVDIANTMNKFFVEKIHNIRSSITPLPNNFEKCTEIMENKNCKLGLSFASQAKINNMLKSLNNSKSLSLDGLDNVSVKLAANIIDKPLHHIVTLSIMQNRFPTCWKFSKVIPLHKKESRMEAKNLLSYYLLMTNGSELPI